MGVQDEQLHCDLPCPTSCVRARGLPCSRVVAILRPAPSQGKSVDTRGRNAN
jgi:hypothetical protein